MHARFVSGLVLTSSSLSHVFHRLRSVAVIAPLLWTMGISATWHTCQAEPTPAKGKPATPKAVWTQFRGPSGDGQAGANPLPTQWSETDNVAWKAVFPGRGWSSPVVDGNLVWLTTAVEEPIPADELEARRKERFDGHPLAGEMTLLNAIQLLAIAVDARGNLVHQIELFRVENPDAVHGLNSYASPTPVIVGDRVVCHFGSFGTACINTQTGDVIWRQRLSIRHSVGPGSSPVIDGNRVILTCDGTDHQYMTALNLETGEELWKTNRPPLTGNQVELHKAFSTPIIAEFAGQKQLISTGAQWVVAYNPASGKEIWRVRHGEGFSNVPRPIVGHGLVFICTGYMSPQLWAIRPDGTGDVTDTHVVWQVKKQVPAMPSPILVGNEVIMVSDQGVVSRIDARTGDLRGTRRIGGNYSSSPLAAAGKLYFCSREGKTTVLLPDEELTEVAVNELDGQLMASPGVWGSTLLLRSGNTLYRIGAPVESNAATR